MGNQNVLPLTMYAVLAAYDFPEPCLALPDMDRDISTIHIVWFANPKRVTASGLFFRACLWQRFHIRKN